MLDTGCSMLDDLHLLISQNVIENRESSIEYRVSRQGPPNGLKY